MMHREEINVTGASGGSGAATATAISNRVLSGKICGVHVAYIGTPPATTDVTIEEANNGPAVNILTLTNANADGWFYPKAQAHTPAGVAISAEYMPIAISDSIQVTIAGANDDDGVTVTLLVEG